MPIARGSSRDSGLDCIHIPTLQASSKREVEASQSQFVAGKLSSSLTIDHANRSGDSLTYIPIVSSTTPAVCSRESRYLTYWARDDKMFQFRLPSWPDFSSLGVGGGGIKLPKVETHEIEANPEKRARSLKHLIKANHINYSIIYGPHDFHNHTTHILGSAYILGADPDQLTHIYEAEGKHLEPWKDSPGEIARHDWRDFLGKVE